MRISTDNGPIRNRFGDVQATQMIADAGFDGIDYTFYDIDPNNDILALPDADRRALADDVAACARAAGIEFPQSHAPLAYRADESRDSKNYQDIIKSMEFAARIGCKQIVIHTVKFPRSDRHFDVNGYNREFMRSFLPYAEEYDLTIGVENLFIPDKKRQCFFGQHGTPEEMNEFVDSLNHPRFRSCCDLGHCALTGCEPEDFIRGMKADRLTMLHVQDTDYLSDTHTIPYLGKHNWDAITDALAEIGYTGWMNMEVLHFYEEFPDELVPAALRMAAAAARKLAKDFESKIAF